LEEFLHTQESTEDGHITTIVCGEKITIDQALIIQQFGNCVERMIDVTNALVKKAQVYLKNIVGLDAFINKEQWSIIRMKEEYHTRFVTILQIIYQWGKVSLF
jgi:hypothetical protein